MKVPKDLVVSTKKVILRVFIITLLAVAFIISYNPSLHQEDNVGLKVRLGSEFLQGQL